MFRKISNTASRSSIEKEFGLTYRFPDYYTPKKVIDGCKETTLSVIVMEKPTKISYALWGLLPDNFEEGWNVFQDALNTLTIAKNNLRTHTIFKEPFQKRRCLIIITGFFAYCFRKGKLYPYYVHMKNNAPFSIAGVYNTLSDGFMTCSIITQNKAEIDIEISNLTSKFPIVIPKDKRDSWLASYKNMDVIDALFDNLEEPLLTADPVTKDFFDDVDPCPEKEETMHLAQWWDTDD